jgi:hypothetical protein
VQEVFPLLNNDFESSSDDDEEIAFMKKQLRQLKRNKFKEKLGSDLEEEEEETEGEANGEFTLTQQQRVTHLV